MRGDAATAGAAARAHVTIVRDASARFVTPSIDQLHRLDEAAGRTATSF
jgi:hypothetical protein